MAHRYVRVVLPATVAGASSGALNLGTFDDNRTRKIVNVYVSGGALLQHTQLNIAGRVFADLDHAMFGTGRGPLELDQQYPPGVLISYNVIVDAGGTAIAANTVVLTIEYDSDPILASSGT